MRNIIFALFIISCICCQSTKIKSNTYKVTSSVIEFGAIGPSKSLFNLQNNFESKAIARLENKIRLSIEVVPFNKELNKIYQQKAKFNQNQPKLNYIDTIHTKPELVLLRFLDVSGFINELNAPYNNEILKLIREAKNEKIVSSVALAMSKEEIAKIRQADAYYLGNTQEKKYNIILFKQGKKMESLEINSQLVVCYRLSEFCWAANDRGNWYIADMAEGSNACAGNTRSKIKEKEKIRNLYKM